MQDFNYNAMLTKASQELLNKSSSNLPLEMIYSIVASRIKVFLLLSKEASPKSKKLVNSKSLFCNMDMSIFFIVFRMVSRFSEELEQLRR